MGELFPHNCYDTNIVNQSEIEYRTAKYPFHMRHRYIDAATGEHKSWDSAHCPVCFWKNDVDLWDSIVDRGTLFCRRCGQKLKWDAEENGKPPINKEESSEDSEDTVPANM